MLIGPNPCAECGGEYGEHRQRCSLKSKRLSPCCRSDVEILADGLIACWVCGVVYYLPAISRHDRATKESR